MHSKKFFLINSATDRFKYHKRTWTVYEEHCCFDGLELLTLHLQIATQKIPHVDLRVTVRISDIAHEYSREQDMLAMRWAC